VEAVTLHLQSRKKQDFRLAMLNGSDRIDVVVDSASDTLCLLKSRRSLPRAAGKLFDSEHRCIISPAEEVLEVLERLRGADFPEIRLSQEIGPWLENRRCVAERLDLRREYELKVQSGEWPAQETHVPLFPYQREGMLHLAFTERALLADEMGLGKTIQAIAACALLKRLGKARRVLVVTPASLKTEWEEQIRRFTGLDLQIIFGGKIQRLKAYRTGLSALISSHGESRNPATPGTADSMPFFTIVNYEQMVVDAPEVNADLAPDIIVLDEAQRIKNWGTKTARAVKQLQSRYAFVLTGTPIENRIDELHSIMSFLNPAILGPLFRFNRDFYEMDERGRPVACRNLDQLHQRIKPFMLRRRKAEVETELPARTDRNFFVKLSEHQRQNHAAHEQEVSKLVQIAKRRPLTPQQMDKLQRELAMMRMVCDTNYILDQEDETCPKLVELEKLLDECIENDAKVIIFSEWERMLELVRKLCRRRDIGHAWHTGSVPQKRRRDEINAFKNDPGCRVFLSTDSGATGLNLQNASVVINCDLPWNPARLEQRIARAWRKNQIKPVTVINLISEESIEYRMLDTLALKQSLATSVLDKPGEVTEIKLRSGRQAMIERLEQLVSTRETKTLTAASDAQASIPADPVADFVKIAINRINGALVRCEERFPQSGGRSTLLFVVERDSGKWRQYLNSMHSEWFLDRNQADSLQLEVIDRETYENMERLITAGLISRTARLVRPLFPAENTPVVAQLSAEEKARAQAHRDRANRKLKMARLLGDGGFEEETRLALQDSLWLFGCALAVENRLPEPADLKDVLKSPLAGCWVSALPVFQNFVEDTGSDWKPVAEQLKQV